MGAPSFLIQTHAARRLHYNCCLELDGALVIWAVTHGLNLVAGERRLAMLVEDHRLDYADFDRVILAGSYGAGAVLLSDRGTREPDGDAFAKLANGWLSGILHSEKLLAADRLLRTKPRPGSGNRPGC